MEASGVCGTWVNRPARRPCRDPAKQPDELLVLPAHSQSQRRDPWPEFGENAVKGIGHGPLLKQSTDAAQLDCGLQSKLVAIVHADKD
jgi:hypothetical protein